MSGSDWARDAVFYHIYPLGFCGAPERNDFSSPPVPRIRKISEWIPHIRDLGATAVYLGPVFESSEHGYDTRDYRNVDRRLGSNADLGALSAELHGAGLRLVLDGVFNHSGRDYPPFLDLRAKGPSSPFAAWFRGVDFSRRSPCGDPFSYEGWRGHYNLARLDVRNREVRDELFDIVRFWVDQFDIDGLRLDAADCLEFEFLSELSAFCRSLKPDFWLMGEVIHGDYRRWIEAGLDSVTNYEAYKGLWSSHNDANYFEIAYSLNRQFGEEGIYQGLPLYSFADNHDVDRVASILKESAHLYPLAVLLFAMPGIPSIYYGSEWGIGGRKTEGSDAALRPELDLAALRRSAPQPDLPAAIRRLAAVRRDSPALREGDYRQLLVSAKQLAFARWANRGADPWADGAAAGRVGGAAAGSLAVVAVNADSQRVEIRLKLPEAEGRTLRDALEPKDEFRVRGGEAVIPLHPHWGRILESV